MVVDRTCGISYLILLEFFMNIIGDVFHIYHLYFQCMYMRFLFSKVLHLAKNIDSFGEWLPYFFLFFWGFLES